MSIGTILARIPSRLAFWALAGFALFISHDAIFLIQVGPGEALTRSLRGAGHDYWGIASLALAIAGAALVAGAWLRLRALRRRAAGLDMAAATVQPSRLLSTWLRLLATVAIGFLIQENVEHYLNHAHAPGLGVLIGPEYPLAIPVIAAITGMAALLATATGRTELRLLAVIAAAVLTRFGRAPRDLARPPQTLPEPRRSPLARYVASRAPPSRFASAT